MNEQDFEEKVKKDYKHYLRLANSEMNNHADAEDIVQQTLLELWEKRDTFEGRSNFNTYFIASLNNQILKWRRDNKDDLQICVEHEIFTGIPDSKWVDPSIALDVQSALSRLPRQEQQVCRLVLLEGYTLVEAEDLLGLSKQVLRRILLRGSERLKEFLAEYQDEYRSM